MLGFVRRLLGFTPSRPQLTEADWTRVEKRLPFLDFLDPAERLRLRALALDFLESKQFDAAPGLVLENDMMLTVALQACLPVLNIGLDVFRGWVGIVLYPGEIIIPRHEVDDDGVVHEYDDQVLGEAWDGGPVLLSGFDQADCDGPNVVIHEFAHKLDMSNGEADGFPPLPVGMSRQAWARIFSAAYDSLCEAVDGGYAPPIDPYASEHPAEFFAVTSELFFTHPWQLLDAYPDVYDQLKSLYRLDPAVGAARVADAMGARGR